MAILAKAMYYSAEAGYFTITHEYWSAEAGYWNISLLEKKSLTTNSHSHRVTVRKKGTFYIERLFYYIYNLLIIIYIDIYNIYKKEIGGTLKNNCDSVTVTGNEIFL